MEWAGNLDPVPDNYFTKAMEYFYEKYNVSHKINNYGKCSSPIILSNGIEPMFYYVSLTHFYFQHVHFYVLTDDIDTAKQRILTRANKRFDISFPGTGITTAPGNLLC